MKEVANQTSTWLPIARPDLRGNEESYVVEAIRSSWISSSGRYLDRFEQEFAEVCGTRHAIAVCNGTVALHLALLALDVRPGDEVIVPSMTYVATANACRYVGAMPVFVDVDPKTWCISPNEIEDAITVRTKGIIPVHLYGHPSQMDQIEHIAAVNGLWVLEDAAEAHFARFKGKTVGGFGKMGTFSFYGNKIITSGEGGAITMNDDDLALRVRTLRGQGMDPARRYYFPVTGYNFRMTNIAAAMLCAQLERKESLRQARRALVEWYQEDLGGTPGIRVQQPAEEAEVAHWLMCILVEPDEFGMSRDELAAYLLEAGIETRPFFIPLHTMPPFREGYRLTARNLPVTERLGHQGLNLPTFTEMTRDDVLRVTSTIRDAHEKHRSR